MKKYSHIVVTGSMSWDTIMDFPYRFVDFLQKDKLHELNVSFVVKTLEKQIGGTATNIAYGASQVRKQILDQDSLKQKKIYVLGALGKDGKDHLSLFKKNGINVQGIIINKTKFSAHGSVITDIKDNQIWGFYYGACEDGGRADLKGCVDNKSLLIVSANHPHAFLAAQKYAIDNNIDYVYDAGMTLTWIKDPDLLKGTIHAKYLIGNDYEIARIIKRTKKSLKELVKKGVAIITTMGEKGVTYESLDEVIEIPAYRVKRVIDPTGAGDAWRGGFMMAKSYGYDMIDCLKIGNVAASFAIEKYGTVNYKISKGEFNKRLKQIV
ncbi:hypothetical protein A2446_03540 [Candidatus Roizmanbacteria bacterium RIFOXYC2_FULL_38_9]|nr:MAG: hypothetical protein A2446_03540 [Candidatus Roizmanbacteria bacterium RIFOXYC2_FULL_38_9]